MIFKKLRYLLEKLFNIHIRFVKKNIYKNLETPDIDIIKSITRSSGILHIGGHRGSERFTYDWMGKKVIWIEANPIIFRELKSNLKEFKYQQCYQALLHSTKGKWLDFFLSSNDQASSSIYDFSKTFKNNDLFFQNIKRNISMVDKIKLKTQKLDDLILEKNIDVRKFNHWVIDVQGAELEVLKGSVESIKLCNSITVEVSTENFYEQGSEFNDVKEFLNKFNFKVKKDPKRNHEDVVFIRNDIN